MYSESFRLNRSRSMPPIVQGRYASSTGSTWLRPIERHRDAGEADAPADPEAPAEPEAEAEPDAEGDFDASGLAEPEAVENGSVAEA